MTFNIFAAKRVPCFGQYNRIDDFISCKLRGEKRPVFRQFLVDEFHSSAVFKCFDPLFVSHVPSLSRKLLNDRCGLFRLWPRGSRALDTNVSSKFFVALGFVLLLHSIQGFVKERTGRLKHPVALGATEALKVLFLIPYQLAWHGWSIGLTMCKREQYLQAETCLKSGRRGPGSQGVDA